MQLREIDRLDECYRLESGTLFLTGLQALVRLLLTQRYRDQRENLNTAGFVSGYRGSPLGGLDRELWRARPFLDSAHVRFEPGLNEDLAATSIWGTQQANLFPGARYDGVFSLWYGKGPGVDRSGDAFKARQFGRHRSARRRARGGRRRPHLQVLVAAAPERIRLHRCDDAGAESGRCAGTARLWAVRFRTVAIQRLLGRAQGDPGDGRRDPDRLERPWRTADRPTRFRDAARRAQYPLARSSQRPGRPAAASQALRGARVRTRQRAQSRCDRVRSPASSAS